MIYDDLKELLEDKLSHFNQRIAFIGQKLCYMHKNLKTAIRKVDKKKSPNAIFKGILKIICLCGRKIG